jgi:hypothetical protein
VIKINKKIASWAVIENTPSESTPVVMNEFHERPEQLVGTTYKIKTPLSEHALYVTINDVVINEKHHPFEIFINCKSMENFQWVIALTRLISAVFRKGGNVEFLVEELRSVFCPKGGYFRKGKYIPSLVSEIGDVIEDHLVKIGSVVKDTSLADAAKAMIKEKENTKTRKDESKLLCSKCNEVAVVMMDGCLTCTNCGDSKCN